MKQTAVEFLSNALDINTKSLVFEKAKEMERQQIINAYEKAMERDIYHTPLKVGKQYYEETFNKKVK
jgi:hypothetical protein